MFASHHSSHQYVGRTSKNKKLSVAMSVAASLYAVSSASAYLGSFEMSDGYYIASPGWVDVTYYNAGQWGANAGGGASPTAIAPDSGLWSLNSQAGAFFPTTAARNAAVSGAPPYPSPSSIVGIPAYIIGNHSPGRTGIGALALRNENFIGAGPMDYDYTLDTYDFGGPAPASVTSGVVDTGFYFCPNPSDPVNPGSPPRIEKFIMSFRDSASVTGLQIGYTGANQVYWRPGSSGAWTLTSIIADATNWDGFDVKIDLTSDTFGIDYFDVSASTWSTMVPAGTALGAPMQDLTHLGWWLDEQVTNGTGGKNFFDDFSFKAIPEPASAALIGLGSIGLMSRGRKNG